MPEVHMQATMACLGAKLQLHTSLTEVDVCCVITRPHYPWGKSSDTHWIGGSVSPIGDFDALENRKFLTPEGSRGTTPRLSGL